MGDQGAQWHELKLADGTLCFLEWKAREGLPPLHFAHANGFNAATYRRLLAPLATDFHIRAWDARGHGRTQLPADPSSLRDWHPYRDDLIRLLEDFARAAGGPVIAAGHSMGATTSLLAAALRPDLVRGLVLIEPVIMPWIVRLLSQLSHVAGIKFDYPVFIQGTRRRRAIFPDRTSMFERYRGRGAFRTWPEELVCDYIEGGTLLRDDGQVELTCSPLWEAANFSAQGHNPHKALRQYHGPLTLLQAARGSTCRKPAPAHIAARGGDTQMFSIEGATHFLPMEFPDLVRREIRALQARLDNDGSSAAQSWSQT